MVRWIVTYGTTEEKMRRTGLITKEVGYPRACDNLTRILEGILMRSYEDVRYLEDQRDGKSFSVKFTFDCSHRPSPAEGLAEVLEIEPYTSVYDAERMGE